VAQVGLARSKLSLELQRELDVQTATTTPSWFGFLTLHKVRILQMVGVYCHIEETVSSRHDMGHNFCISPLGRMFTRGGSAINLISQSWASWP